MKLVIFRRSRLLLILAAAFLIRLYGIHFGLPYLYHADEPVIVNHALAYGTGDFNPNFFRVPPLASYFLFMIYGLFFAAGKISGFFSSTRDFELLFYSDPSIFYLLGRFFLGVLPGTFSVYLLFRLVRKYYDETTAFFTALFFACSFLHVRDSHYIYTDMLLITAMTAAFFPVFAIAGQGSSKRSHLMAGAAIGLSAAFKYNGIFLVFPYLAASLMGRARKETVFHWFIAGCACIGVFFLLNPYAFFDYSFFMQEIVSEGKAHAGGTHPAHHLRYSLWEALGPAFLFTCAAGLAVSLKAGFPRQSRRQTFSALVFAAAYYCIIVYKGQPYDRYVLPLLPFAALFAALFMRWAYEKLRPERRWWVGLAAAAILIFPLMKIFLLLQITGREDTRTLAKRWIEENIPKNASIAAGTPFYMPRLLLSSAQLEEAAEAHAASSNEFHGVRERRLRFYIAESRGKPSYTLYTLSDEMPESRPLFAPPPISPDMDSLREKGIRYVLLAGAAERKSFPELAASLREKAARTAVFSPYWNEGRSAAYDEQPLTGLPFTWKELLNRKRGGMPIEIFRIQD